MATDTTMTSTDAQPTPEAIALATAILQRRAEHAAKKAERAARATPVATYAGLSYPLGSPVYGFAGYPTRIERLGVIAGVCLTDGTKVVIAPEWHAGAPVHRYENSKEAKRYTLGHGAWPAWSMAWEEMRRRALATLGYAEKSVTEARTGLAAVDAMAPPAGEEPVK